MAGTTTYAVTRRDATNGRQYPRTGGEVVYDVAEGEFDSTPPAGTYTADQSTWKADALTPTADAT
jgi:hypothetical protein